MGKAYLVMYFDLAACLWLIVPDHGGLIYLDKAVALLKARRYRSETLVTQAFAVFEISYDVTNPVMIEE